MTAIPPAAAATVAAETVRPVASSATRILFAAGLGFGTFAGVGMWADKHFSKMPQADGTSPGYIDRMEARSQFAGSDGWPAIVSFTALLGASFLYTHGREHLSPKEFAFVKYVGYGFLGGGLVGTSVAPSLLRPLPKTDDKSDAK
jgi:hypothetical protein